MANWNSDQGGRGYQQRSYGGGRDSGRANGFGQQGGGRWGQHDDRGDQRQGFGGGRGRDDDGGDSTKTMIQKRDVGKIIGKGGSRIREIQDESGARVNISRDNDSGYEVPVEITGTEEQRLKAKDIIDKILSQDSGFGGDRGFGRREERGGSFGFGQSSGVTNTNIPKNDVGKVIGRGGSMIRKIQDETGAGVKISREGGNNYEVPVEITGSEEERQSAKEMIMNILAQDSGFGGGSRRDDSGEVTRFLTAKSNVGKIIGKGGSTIREIQDESGANVKIIKAEESYDESPIELRGSAEARQHAKEMIDRLLDDY